MWNERYSAEAFAYGEQPNEFLKAQLQLLQPAAILFPAEGEGRNAVFAATLGWRVAAFDISEAGQKKAMQLAEKHGVIIDYQVGELQPTYYGDEEFDAIALIYAHFPAGIKSQMHRMLDKFLCKNGILIFEAFSKRHLEYNSQNPKVGGPKDLGMLFSIEEIQADFPAYDFLSLSEQEIELNEGLFHNGKGSVIRFVARKK